MNRYQETADSYNRVAEQYQSKFMEFDLYNDSYDFFCSLIQKPNAQIFEIGCGPGNITRYLLKKRSDFNILAIDFAPNMIKLAKENNPTADFELMECREIHLINKKFDAIICGFCLPYLTKEDCTKLIKDCSYLLNESGVFYFSIIEDEYSKSQYTTSSDGQHKMFIYAHQSNYLLDDLKKHHFQIIDIQRKNYAVDLKSNATHSVFISKKIL